MTPLLQAFVEALRTELKQYGEMLALLENQQAVVARHGADAVASSVSAITVQAAAIETGRQHRQLLLHELSVALACPDSISCAGLIPHLPEEYRPLVQALGHENNELLERVRERAQQNQRLMRHSLDLMQRF